MLRWISDCKHTRTEHTHTCIPISLKHVSVEYDGLACECVHASYCVCVCVFEDINRLRMTVLFEKTEEIFPLYRHSVSTLFIAGHSHEHKHKQK